MKIILVIASVIGLLAAGRLEPAVSPDKNVLLNKSYTVADRVKQYGEQARSRWAPYFERAGVAYPGKRFAFVGLKEEKELEVYVTDADGNWKFIRSLPVKAASGGPGPKLRQGDGQVPEGDYRISFLNPNSRFHLSLRVNYPNGFDKEKAREDGRTNLGGDIMIHGNAVSIGCLAMGDTAAEDLFILAADTGIGNSKVLLVPHDFRTRGVGELNSTLPSWVAELYSSLEKSLKEFPKT